MNSDEAPSPIDLAREPRFTLGGAEVLPATRELVAAGRREVLEPRIMQVLVALARRRGEVVSRGELVAACWGGRAVSEDAINRSISVIRRLADAHGGFRIETVARVGYRLGGVESWTAAPTPAQTDSGPTAHWAAIKNSLDAADYGDFLEVFPQAEQAFEARRQNISFEEMLAKRSATNPTGRVGDPAEFGAACAFLCAASSGFIVGQNLLLDGGAFNSTMG